MAKYMVLRSGLHGNVNYSVSEIDDTINKYICDGWLLQGGISIVVSGNEKYNSCYMAFQAIYKPLSEELDNKHRELNVIKEITSLKTSLELVTSALEKLALNISKLNIPKISEHSEDPDKI